MREEKIEVYLKEKYPHMNELDDYIVDEIHKYVEEFCGYGGDESEEFDRGFSQALEMCLCLIDHFSKECVKDEEIDMERKI